MQNLQPNIVQMQVEFEQFQQANRSDKIQKQLQQVGKEIEQQQQNMNTSAQINDQIQTALQAAQKLQRESAQQIDERQVRANIQNYTR